MCFFNCYGVSPSSCSRPLQGRTDLNTKVMNTKATVLYFRVTITNLAILNVSLPPPPFILKRTYFVKITFLTWTQDSSHLTVVFLLFLKVILIAYLHMVRQLYAVVMLLNF